MSFIRIKTYYQRKYFDISSDDNEDDDYVSDDDVSLFLLIHAFKQVIDNIPKITVHEIKDIEISTQEQSEFILNYLTSNIQISFVELLSRFRDKLIMVVTFIALLDLIRQELIVAD